jgi:drug/metabolite transporter (DMT)-like permease
MVIPVSPDNTMITRAKAEFFLLTTTLIWGSTFVAMKIGMTGMSALMLIASRFAMTSLFFLLFFHRKVFPIPMSSLVKGVILGLFLFLGFVAQTVGLNYTTASKSSFITSVMVVFVPMLQYVIERRPPTVGNILGILVVCTGLWLLTSPAGSTVNIGDALTMVCAVLFAFYLVYLDIVSKEMGEIQLTFLQVSTCAVLAWGGVLLTEKPTIPSSRDSLLALGYLTIFATLITTFVQTKYQKHTTPTRAAIIFTIEPVFASIFAFLILGEQIGAPGILGGGLIVAGVLLSELSDSIPGLGKAARRQDRFT